MTSRRLVIAAIAASSLSIVPGALAVDGAPLPVREGVVIAWHAPTKTAVVVTRDQRVYAVHALRRVAPGRRVRVDGIKWGTPVSGIKWAAPRAGIKWGIARATNGSYRSGLTPLRGFATTMALRGRVVRRVGTRGVVVAIPGARIVVPFRGAVWLPGGVGTKGTTELGQFGARVTVTLRRDARGRIFSNRVVETAPAAELEAIPVSGKITAVDATAKTITIQAGDSTLPVSMTFTVPPATDLALYPIGSQIAARLVAALPPDTGFAAVALSLNATFAQADSPITNVIVPAPNPAHLAAIDDLQARWIAGQAAGEIQQTGLFQSQQQRLNRIEFMIVTGDKAAAVKELEQFEMRFQNVPPGAINDALRAKMLELSVALRGQLATP